jgi:hypothetical protein
MYRSLFTKNNSDEFDFLVVTNNQNAEQIPHTIVYDGEFPIEYAGYLKYSSKLPAHYDNYLYLDSDVLFYEKIENVIPSDSLICAMKESDCPMFDNEWHRYRRLDEKTLQLHANKWCVNAGQFSYKRESKLTENVRKYLCTNNNLINSCDHAKNEQSSFNRYLLDVWDEINFSKLTNAVTLFPEREPSKTIFHFIGFSSEGMYAKMRRMVTFASQHHNHIS